LLQAVVADRIPFMDFPTKLSKLCWQRGWTQRDLAERLDGVSKSTVSNWMTGKTDPRRKELVQVARLFGVPVTYLASDQQEEPTGDGLSEIQRRVLWAAETVGYELALKRIMNVPGSAAEGVTHSTDAEPNRGKKGRVRRR
jgi:transcriptional regulator with XRE-family HTH domain